jgi:hypothetical protein
MIISNYKTLNEEWFPQFPESVAYGISRELCDKLKTDRKSIENEFLEFHIEKESDVEKIRDVRINHTFSEYLYYEKIAEEKRKKYLKNAFRVLLTRARQGMVIFVPKGDQKDKSRLPEFYDVIFNDLKEIGIKEI